MQISAAQWQKLFTPTEEAAFLEFYEILVSLLSWVSQMPEHSV